VTPTPSFRPPYFFTAPDDDGWIDVHSDHEGKFRIKIAKHGHRWMITALELHADEISNSILYSLSMARLDATINTKLWDG
jgi:hypothetical protein